MKNYGTWNKMTISGQPEELENFRNEVFSVDSEASHDEADKRMALDLNKVTPKSEHLADNEALSHYIKWHAEEGYTVDEMAEFIWGDDLKWQTRAKQFPLLIDLSDDILAKTDREFVAVGIRLLKKVDPDFHAKSLHHWCYENWRTQYNTCVRYNSAVTPTPGGDGPWPWTLQCRFDTDEPPMPIFERLVDEWPELEFRFVSCIVASNYAIIGVGYDGEFIHQGTNQFREVLANEFGYLVPSGFSVSQYGQLWGQFPSTYFAPNIDHNQSELIHSIDSTEMVL